MAKISLLEQMRMQRDQREGPEIKELRSDLATAQERYAHSVRLRVQIEQIVSKVVFKPMMERIGYELGDALLRHIYQEIAKSPPKGLAQDFYINIPSHHLAHLDSDSTLSLILQQYKYQKHYPQIEFRGVSGNMEEKAYRVMEVRIKIPELHYREVVEV